MSASTRSAAFAAAMVALLHASAAEESGACSRELSRRVRSFLHKSVYPKLAGSAADLPWSCQLNPALDVYREQELNKKEVSRGDWKCLFCGKHFRSEDYLDKHMHNRHMDKLTNDSTTTCLADLCPVFGCDDKQANLVARRGGGGSGGGQHLAPPLPRPRKEFGIDNHCTPQELEKNKHRCEVLTRRCFARDASAQHHFEETVCGKLRCEGRELRGILEASEASANGASGGAFSYSLLRWLSAGLLLLFAAVYTLFSGARFDFRSRNDPTMPPPSRGGWAQGLGLSGTASPAHSKKKM